MILKRVAAGALAAVLAGPCSPGAHSQACARGLSGFDKADWASGQVSSDSIRAYLLELSTYPDGTSRSRQYLRDETTEESLAFIEAKLANYLQAPGDTVWRQPFEVSWHEGTESHIKDIYNGIGLHRGSVGGGTYILCGHYDTTARRTEGWDWMTDPAPGADDNGTGVSCVLECARVLGAMSFEFDIRFVLFTGEEYGILGSQHYVEEALAAGDSILGVLNIDMVGYDPLGRKQVILLANDRSEWIVDWLLEMNDRLALDLNPQKVPMPGDLVYRSDHGPFLVEGYPAISAWESVEGDSSVLNPYYHTLGDTLGSVSVPLVAQVASLFAGSLALLADPGSARDLEVPANGVIVRPSQVAVGDSATVLAVVRNRGPAATGPIDLTAEFFEGPSGESGRHVSSLALTLDLPAGAWKYVEIPWMPRESSLGMRDLRVRVTPDSPGVDLNPDNNEGTRQVVVEASRVAVFDAYAYPNPVKAPEHALGDLRFHYQLSHGMNTRITVYTLEGQEVASVERLYDSLAEPEGTTAGPNRVSWESLVGRPASLAPGLYIFSIEAWDGLSEDQVFGKFAVIR